MFVTAILASNGSKEDDGKGHKGICKLILGSNREQFDRAVIDFISVEMVIQFNVFGPLMEDGIGSNVYCGLIITKQKSRCGSADTKIIEKVFYPNKFTGGDC